MMKEYKKYLNFNNKLGFIVDIDKMPLEIMNSCIKIVNRFNKSYKLKQAIKAKSWFY